MDRRQNSDLEKGGVVTLPDERYRAVVNAQIFLRALLDPKKTPRVPRDVRETAARILRHYPSIFDLWHAKMDFDAVFKIPREKGES